MCFVIFETVEVLVSFVAHVTLVWFLLLHADSARVWLVVVRIENRECTISILLQSLVLMAMSLVILETVCVAVRLVFKFMLAGVQI